MISNLHVPCNTLSLVLCTLDIKNKSFFSFSSIFYVFKNCYHIPSQSDLVQTKQHPSFNLSSLVTFSQLLIMLVSSGCCPTKLILPEPWCLKLENVQQKKYLSCRADGTLVYISQYGICFPRGNFKSSDFCSACDSQLSQIHLCLLFLITYLYIWLFLTKYRTMYLVFVLTVFHPFPSQIPRLFSHLHLIILKFKPVFFCACSSSQIDIEC